MLKSFAIAVFAHVFGSPALAQEALPTPREPAPAGVVESASEALRAHLGAHAARVELEPAGEFSSDECLEPRSLEPRVARNQALAPRMLVTVRAQCGDGHVATLPVWFEVRALAQVAVAARDVPAGRTLEADDVRVAEFDVAARSDVLSDTELAVPLQTLVPLKSGAPIARAAVRATPDVVAQQPVLIRAVAGRATVEMMGLALQSGRVGDRVQVINLSSGDTLLARVTHARAVEIIR